MRRDAAEAIIEPAERWIHLLYEGADRAMEALELARYRRVDIRYAANRASVGLAAGDGWEAEETFASGRELALGLTRLGLERLMLRSHRSEEAFIDAADAKMGRAPSRLNRLWAHGQEVQPIDLRRRQDVAVVGSISLPSPAVRVTLRGAGLRPIQASVPSR